MLAKSAIPPLKVEQNFIRFAGPFGVREKE
jgi:hypothetical protein